MNPWAVNYLEEAVEENLVEMLDQYENFLVGNQNNE